MRWLVVLAAMTLCAAAPARASAPVDATNRWTLVPPASQGMDGALLARGGDFVHAHLPTVHSLLVARHGRLVYERSFSWPRTLPGDVQSVTKSVVSALTGIALSRHELTGLDAPLGDLLRPADIPRTVDPRVRETTLRDLLTMRGGFASDTASGDFGYTFTDNWVRALLSRPLDSAPGTHFEYDSGTAHLVSAALTRATGMPAARYAARNLFGPLGIRDAIWPADATGNSIGGWALELTPRDLAKLGYLYLRQGRWHGRQVVPRAWVRASTARRVPLNGPGSWGLPASPGYGYFWWRAPLPQRDGFMAIGRGGQFIVVVPSLDLVVVTTADVQDGDWDLGSVLRRYVLPAVKGR